MPRTKPHVFVTRPPSPATVMAFWLIGLQLLLLQTNECIALQYQDNISSNSTVSKEIQIGDAKSLRKCVEKITLTSSSKTVLNGQSEDPDKVFPDNSYLGHGYINDTLSKAMTDEFQYRDTQKPILKSGLGVTRNKFPIRKQEKDQNIHVVEHGKVSNTTNNRMLTNPNNERGNPLSPLDVGGSKVSKGPLKRHRKRNKHRDKTDKVHLRLQSHSESNNEGYDKITSLINSSYTVHEETEIRDLKDTLQVETLETPRVTSAKSNKHKKLEILNETQNGKKVTLYIPENKNRNEVTAKSSETQNGQTETGETPVFRDQQPTKNRYVRSANRTTDLKSQTDILPSNCSLASSCAARQNMSLKEGIVWYPCRCDDDCDMYDDCCHDHKKAGQNQAANDHSRYGGRRPLTVTPASWTCKQLTPTEGRDFVNKRTVYQVSNCPSKTRKRLADKCSKKNYRKGSQQYLMDIPVVSATTGIVYANEFCAMCHKDLELLKKEVDLTCNANFTSIEKLTSMTYHPGQLIWTLQNHEQTNANNANLCLMDIKYTSTVGRDCPKNVINTCNKDWTDKNVQDKCQSHNYFVETTTNKYKNWHCALCNKEQPSTIKCLRLYGEDNIFRLGAPPPSLSDIFKHDKDCQENEIWNYLHNRCENVSCGDLFTLIDGKCARNNITQVNDSQSYLNSSCYTSEFQYSVVYPNYSVFLNHTKTIYHVGEYEFVNHSWIRICRPGDRWTPVMNIISTVLISFSQIFMALHMIIFILLPKRRNIPSMNLFCMTLSLFISEMVFIIFFYANQNYGFCVFASVLIYYFFSASFMWMNVMSIDICRTFHSQTYKIKSQKIFIQYSIYAWSVPMIGTFIALIVDQLASPDFILTPTFGTDRCWFNNKWGLAAFFTVPSGLIFLLNLVLYGVSVYDIYKQHKSGEFASSTIKKNKNRSLSRGKNREENEKEKFLKPSSNQKNNVKQESGTFGEMDSLRCAERIRDRIHKRIQAHKKQRMRLVLYSKLALIMGMTWIFAFIQMHVDSLIFEYLFIIFNGLQGTFIFLAFDCKQKLWDELWLRLTGKRLFRTGTKSSSNTGDTALTSSSTNGRYKYRWSSKMNQDGSTRSSTLPKTEQSL